MLAVGRAAAAKSVSEILQKASESLGFFDGRRGDGCPGRDMLSGLGQRGIQVFGGRSVQP